MSEEEIVTLEDNYNQVIHQLNTLLNPIPQAPPVTRVEDVNTIVHDNGKTIRWNLEPKVKQVHNWMKKKAKRQHVEMRSKAKDLIVEQRKRDRQERKWAKRKMKHDEPSIVVDSGATSTCIRPRDAAHVQILNEQSPKVFINANGTTSRAGNKAKLLYDLRATAIEADMVPNLAMNSLLSTGKMADANYVTVFTQDEVKVFDAETAPFQMEGCMVMQGWRCPKTKLWRVPLKPDWTNENTETTLLSKEATQIVLSKREKFDPMEFTNSVYELPNQEQVIAWYHAAAGYPTKATWLKAIEAGFFATWPLLTAKAVKKHYPETEETPKGHMKRVKSGVRSTKAQLEEPLEIQTAEAVLKELRKKHRDVFVQIKDVTEMVYSNQTGRFPVISSQGHKYIMVLIEVDGNYISVEPMKSREASEMIRAYNAIMDRLKNRGIKPMRSFVKPSKRETSLWNWYHQTITGEIWRSERYKRQRGTSLPI
jgi:hypothetical protein